MAIEHQPGCSVYQPWMGITPPPCNCGVNPAPDSFTTINIDEIPLRTRVVDIVEDSETGELARKQALKWVKEEEKKGAETDLYADGYFDGYNDAKKGRPNLLEKK